MVLRNAPGLPRHDDVIPGTKRVCRQACFSQLLGCSAFDHPDLLLPLFVGASTFMKECGLRQMNSFNVPSILTDLPWM